MSDCKDCTKRNPAVPVYSKANPILDQCTSCRNGIGNIIIPPGSGGGGGGKTTELIEGFSIDIENLSDILVDRFRINWAPVTQLTVDLSLVAKSGGASKTNPVLWGTLIDQVELAWVYNRDPDVQLQTLSSPLTDPTLGASERDYIYTPVSVKNSNTSFTISGDTAEGIPEAQASDTKTITFGNYAAWGINARVDSGSFAYADLKTIVEAFLQDSGRRANTTTRARTLFGEGGVLEHFFYCYPKRYGYATFTKNNSPGGFKRLKRVGTTVQVATNDFSPDGDEEDMLISNGIEEEDYHIYQSYADNIADTVTPIIIT